MISAIATIGKLDVQNDQIRTLVFMCLCGSAITNIAKDFKILIGSKLTSKVKILKVNQKVDFRLLTKFGEKSIIILGKLIPCVVGVIGGTFDN